MFTQIQGAESNPQFTGRLEQFEDMYNEGAPEFIVDQGLYYPTATNYGYICTGFESPPGNWNDHHGIFVLDGQDIQYAGLPNECLPYVYHTPDYGSAQSPYNPYNPYIPGAMLGVDGPLVGGQQYHTIPSYENPVSSPAYAPMVLQSNRDIIASGITDPFIDNAASVSRVDGQARKHKLSSKSSNFRPTPLGNVSSLTNSFRRVAEGSRSNAGSSNRPVPHRSGNTGSLSGPASSQIHGGRGSQPVQNVSNGKPPSGSTQMKAALPFDVGLSGFESSDHTLASVDEVRPKLLYGRFQDDVKVSPDAVENNRWPKTNKSKNQLVVKSHTKRDGDPDAQGNITILANQYRKGDFALDHVYAKFFVIKSYSEDDVHKSIKYNVWSSTPNGNKKLNNAYEDAQRIAAADSRGCPIFLFFSVNASGQFCGVAEMTGPVDFHKDMDFWQQDKWSGSFPVKWHMVKDVPNPNFRHIILENNENKPVTNSRDTQEICYKKGLEMLKIFKYYTSNTSLLDDFIYYENRQRILQEEKARLLIKSYGNPHLLPILNPPRKFSISIHDLPSGGHEEVTKHHVDNSSKVKENGEVSSDGVRDSSEKNASAPTEQVSLDDSDINNSTTANENTKVLADGKANIGDELKIGSLTIKSKGSESERPLPATAVNTESVDVVTVGSMPVKVNSSAESSCFLTVGTIPLDPRALRGDFVDSLSKIGPQKC
ncbi:evolutionarily conserved C-terminal region 7 [Forsythia ovata]|uniref:YTH domain-containing family protein n=1 Tax=Forsythia ovata TaxID=205694 RepID=A0ABD1P6S8_9LAMI